MGRIRAFVAIDIPRNVKEELVREYEGMKGRFRGAVGRGMKWVDPSNWHITLKFLGEISEDMVPGCEEILNSCARVHERFRMRLRNVGCFPSPGRPRVVWARMEEDRATLAALASCLDTAFEELGVAREERPFHAHLTLCRIKRPSPSHAPRIISLMEKRFSTRWFEVGELCLFKSTLTSSGPIYSLILKIPLADKMTYSI